MKIALKLILPGFALHIENATKQQACEIRARATTLCYTGCGTAAQRLTNNVLLNKENTGKIPDDISYFLTRKLLIM